MFTFQIKLRDLFISAYIIARNPNSLSFRLQSMERPTGFIIIIISNIFNLTFPVLSFFVLLSQSLINLIDNKISIFSPVYHN